MLFWLFMVCHAVKKKTASVAPKSDVISKTRNVELKGLFTSMPTYRVCVYCVVGLWVACEVNTQQTQKRTVSAVTES